MLIREMLAGRKSSKLLLVTPFIRNYSLNRLLKNIVLLSNGNVLVIKQTSVVFKGCHLASISIL